MGLIQTVAAGCPTAGVAVVAVLATAAAASSDEPPPAVTVDRTETPVVTAGPVAAAVAVLAVAVEAELRLGSTQAAPWRPAAVSRRACASSARIAAALPRRASWTGLIEAPWYAARRTSSACCAPSQQNSFH